MGQERVLCGTVKKNVSYDTEHHIPMCETGKISFYAKKKVKITKIDLIQIVFLC